MSLGRKSVSYTVLEREAQSNRQVYENLLAREKELQVLASSRGNNVRLVEDAEVPGGPFTPNLRRSMLLASLAGLTLAVALVVGLSYFDDTVKTPEDITAKLKAPFLGMIPKVPAGGIARAVGQDAARVRRGLPLAAHRAGLQQQQRRVARWCS